MISVGRSGGVGSDDGDGDGGGIGSNRASGCGRDHRVVGVRLVADIEVSITEI
jgi:hypothetical protein